MKSTAASEKSTGIPARSLVHPIEKPGHPYSVEAYEQLGKPEEAHAWLREALSDAEPDGLVMPFVENYDILKPLLEREIKNDLISKIIEPGELLR